MVASRWPYNAFCNVALWSRALVILLSLICAWGPFALAPSTLPQSIYVQLSLLRTWKNTPAPRMMLMTGLSFAHQKQLRTRDNVRAENNACFILQFPIKSLNSKCGDSFIVSKPFSLALLQESYHAMLYSEWQQRHYLSWQTTSRLVSAWMGDWYWFCLQFLLFRREIVCDTPVDGTHADGFLKCTEENIVHCALCCFLIGPPSDPWWLAAFS